MKSLTGFTLLELLLAAALIAVVMGVIASVFSGGIRVWRQGEDETQKNQAFRFFRYKLGRDLRNAVPFPPIPIEGEKETFRLVLEETAPKGGSPTLVEVRYRVEATGQGQQLTRDSFFLLTGEEKKEVLLEEIPQIQFFYLSKDEEGKLLWREKWAAASGVDRPRWVKVEILLEKEQAPWIQLFSIPKGSVVEEEPHEESP